MTEEQDRLLMEISEAHEQMENDINQDMRISHMPMMAGFYVSKLDFYKRFLDMPSAEQQRVIAEQHECDRGFYHALLQARGKYEAT